MNCALKHQVLFKASPQSQPKSTRSLCLFLALFLLLSLASALPTINLQNGAENGQFNQQSPYPMMPQAPSSPKNPNQTPIPTFMSDLGSLHQSQAYDKFIGRSQRGQDDSKGDSLPPFQFELNLDPNSPSLRTFKSQDELNSFLQTNCPLNGGSEIGWFLVSDDPEKSTDNRYEYKERSILYVLRGKHIAAVRVDGDAEFPYGHPQIKPTVFIDKLDLGTSQALSFVVKNGVLAVLFARQSKAGRHYGVKIIKFNGLKFEVANEIHFSGGETGYIYLKDDRVYVLVSDPCAMSYRPYYSVQGQKVTARSTEIFYYAFEHYTDLGFLNFYSFSLNGFLNDVQAFTVLTNIGGVIYKSTTAFYLALGCNKNEVSVGISRIFTKDSSSIKTHIKKFTFIGNTVKPTADAFLDSVVSNIGFFREQGQHLKFLANEILSGTSYTKVIFLKAADLSLKVASDFLFSNKSIEGVLWSKTRLFVSSSNLLSVVNLDALRGGKVVFKNVTCEGVYEVIQLNANSNHLWLFGQSHKGQNSQVVVYEVNLTQRNTLTQVASHTDNRFVFGYNQGVYRMTSNSAMVPGFDLAEKKFSGIVTFTLLPGSSDLIISMFNKFVPGKWSYANSSIQSIFLGDSGKYYVKSECRMDILAENSKLGGFSSITTYGLGCKPIQSKKAPNY